MKKTIFVLSALMLLVAPAVAQRVMMDNFDQLKVHYSQPRLVIDPTGDYLTLGAAGYIAGGEVGAPALPTMSSLIVVPICEGIEVSYENAVYDTLTLPKGRVMPFQPSRCKSCEAQPFVIDENLYSTDAYYGRPLVSVEYLGTGRDRNYAVLAYSPVMVNPVSGKMIVCRSADVTVHYIGSDAGATMKQYERYYTPAFSLGETLNTLYTNAKDIRTTAPIRMVVMAAQSLQCTALDEFVAWKRQQGMLVDLNYVANGTAAANIAAQLQQMYDEATDAAPAPTYLILVGDIAQLRPFDDNLSSTTVSVMQSSAGFAPDHVTDLYFTTWTSGDKLPDCYQGRFSATDTTTLRNIIDKTLFYERYQFADDSYLGRAALVAGEDNGSHQSSGWSRDNAWIYSDPTMDYAAKLYINAENGYNTVYYYKNDVDYAPEGVTVTGYCSDAQSASILRTRYNSGVGWVNYSAHGDWNCWYKPSFTVTHVNQMRNNNKPSFMIGNCCLSNKFDEGTCLGEALLRKGDRAGAVGYIGATNSTFWGEDFYWSVGLRSNITHNMAPNYDSNRKGMYDRLFHTHGEALADYVTTAGQILVAGNMSVNRASGSSWSNAVAEYYWEIYELMGDPSLMPWLGTAENLNVTSVFMNGPLTVTAAPGAYVALLHGDDYEYVASAFAGADGVASLTAPVTHLDSTYAISVTAQGYKPYLRACTSASVGISEVSNAAVLVSPNPASAATEVRAEGLRRVTLLNMMGQTLQTIAANGDRCTVSLTGVPAGLYLLRVESAAGTTTRKLVVN